MRSAVSNSDAEMDSGATILRNANFDFLAPLGIGCLTVRLVRRRSVLLGGGQHLWVELMFSFNLDCAAASSVRTIAAGCQPLIDRAHVDPATASNPNRRNLARPNRVKTEPVRQSG